MWPAEGTHLSHPLSAGVSHHSPRRRQGSRRQGSPGALVVTGRTALQPTQGRKRERKGCEEVEKEFIAHSVERGRAPLGLAPLTPLYLRSVPI